MLLPDQQQRVHLTELGKRVAGQEEESSAPGRLETFPGGMAGHLRQHRVIQARATQALVVPQETEGLDQIHRYPETGGQAQEGPAILRNVGLKEGKSHGGFR